MIARLTGCAEAVRSESARLCEQGRRRGPHEQRGDCRSEFVRVMNKARDWRSLTDIGIKGAQAWRNQDAQLAYPAVQRHDGAESQGRAGVGGGRCEEAAVFVLRIVQYLSRGLICSLQV